MPLFVNPRNDVVVKHRYAQIPGSVDASQMNTDIVIPVTATVTVTMPVSFVGYGNRPDVTDRRNRYGLRNRYRLT